MKMGNQLQIDCALGTCSKRQETKYANFQCRLEVSLLLSSHSFYVANDTSLKTICLQGILELKRIWYQLRTYKNVKS